MKNKSKESEGISMFTPLHMGTNFMLGVDNYVPLTTNNFEVRIYNMDGSLPGNYSELLTLSTDEVGNITEEQDSIVVHYGNGIIKFPSKVTFSDVDWTLNCYCEPSVLDALKAWRNQVYNPDTEQMGLPSQYMRQVFFIRYDGQGNARQIIRCPGTWINGLNYGGGNQTGGDVVKVQVQFVISKAVYVKPEDFGR